MRPLSSDVTLVVSAEQKEFPAHKAVLAARSPMFAAMLFSQVSLSLRFEHPRTNDIFTQFSESAMTRIEVIGLLLSPKSQRRTASLRVF